ncbi:hypothetical protein GW17_00020022 [Ensete ventricosum]|nr:hypothetical protein GW17_00020022 [Ensete ventricosum]
MCCQYQYHGSMHSTYHLSPAGDQRATTARARRQRADEDDDEVLLLLSSFPLLLFPFSSSIDRRRSISPSIDHRQPTLAVPSGSGQSAYQSAAGPVRGLTAR